MEKELERKIFYFKEYTDNKVFKETIKKYMEELKNKYPGSTILKEFYIENNVLVRCIKVEERNNSVKDIEQQRKKDGKERYKEERSLGSGGDRIR